VIRIGIGYIHCVDVQKNIVCNIIVW
jgi:hypothetical protein